MYCNVEFLDNQLYVSKFNNNKLEFNTINDFKPSFFIEDKDGEFTLFKHNNKLKKINTNLNDFYLEKEKYKNVYNFFSPKYQYIQKHFYGYKLSDLNLNYKIHHLDIETYSNKDEIDPFEANDPITLIQIMESDTSEIYIFGLKEIKNINKFEKEFNKTYFLFDSEIDMLNGYINFVKEKNPLITDAWYGNLFDFPYLVNRCINLKINYLEFSPFKKFKTRKVVIFGEQKTILIPCGRYWIDSYELYEYFNNENIDSSKLNDVGEKELNLEKIDYSNIADNLNDLYDNHYDKFIEYGIRDVVLLYKLNKKFDFINIMINQAWDMGINFDDIFSIVKSWTYKIYNELIKQNIVLPNIQNIEEKENYLGGHIYQEKPGKYEMILGFDIKSEYPNSMRANNISPETLVEENDLKKFKNYNFLRKLQYNLKTKGKEDYFLNLSIDEYKEIIKILKEENIVLSTSGDYFYKNIDGFLPKIISEIFSERENIIKKVDEYNRIKELCKLLKKDKNI